MNDVACKANDHGSVDDRDSMFYMLSDCQQSTILQTTITQLTITDYLIFISFFCKNSNCSDAAIVNTMLTLNTVCEGQKMTIF